MTYRSKNFDNKPHHKGGASCMKSPSISITSLDAYMYCIVYLFIVVAQ